MITFNPFNWYWRSLDGRVYSSARQEIVAIDDTQYQAWLAPGDRVATSWPIDANGTQSAAALQAVLAPFGLFVDLKAYAAAMRYQKEVGGAVVNGAPCATDRETQAKITAAVVLAQTAAGTSIKWKNLDGSFVTLDAAGINAMASAVAAHVQACFATEATVAAGIDTGAIKTMAQVAAAFAS